MIVSMHWQKEINEQIIELLYSTQTQLLASDFSLISAAFIYGVLHSLGPDHGKLIVTTYLSTHPTKAKISLILTVLSVCAPLRARKLTRFRPHSVLESYKFIAKY